MHCYHVLKARAEGVIMRNPHTMSALKWGAVTLLALTILTAGAAGGYMLATHSSWGSLLTMVKTVIPISSTPLLYTAAAGSVFGLSLLVGGLRAKYLRHTTITNAATPFAPTWRYPASFNPNPENN